MSFQINVVCNIHLISQFELDDGSGYAISKAAMNSSIGMFHAQYKKQGALLTPEQMAKAGGMFQNFLAYSPHFKGPATPEAAVKDIISAWEKASISGENDGTYVSHYGNKQWL
ncbi:hypothetical protein ACHAPX_003181 [Trichoderma viride]